MNLLWCLHMNRAPGVPSSAYLHEQITTCLRIHFSLVKLHNCYTKFRNAFGNWLIDWGLTPLLTISQLYHGGQFTYSYISWFFHTSTPHNFCQSSERKLAEPGFELTTPGLTTHVATDWATGARLGNWLAIDWRCQWRVRSNYGR